MVLQPAGHSLQIAREGLKRLNRFTGCVWRYGSHVETGADIDRQDHVF
jgi:hypothetical protein